MLLRGKTGGYTYIEKPLEMPDWNLSCLMRIVADHLENFDYLHLVFTRLTSLLCNKSILSWFRGKKNWM